MTDLPKPIEVMNAYAQAIAEINEEWAKSDERHSFIPAVRIRFRVLEILYGGRDERAA
jgi:hypothetical protein